MNVVHLTSGGDVGGAKTHVLGLLKELNKTQTVHLVCFTRGDFAKEAREKGIHTTVLDSGNLFAVRKQLIALLKDWDTEVIHCHGARANLMASLLKKQVKLPVVTTVHSDYKLDYLGRPLARLFYGTANAWALRRLDYYIGVADPMAELLIRRKFDPQRIFTIYNGVAFPAPTPAHTRQETLEALGVTGAEEKVIFGIAARLSPVKDISTLLRAFAAAAGEKENIHLLIAGDGEEKEKLQRLTRELGIREKVTFCGWVEDMDSFYAALDVNCLSSLSECFPYALPEGARQYCATISSRVGGVPHYLSHGVDGYLFEPGDVAALKKYILRLAGDKALRQRLARRLYEKTRDHYSVDAMVASQKEIYARLLAKEARKGRKRDGVMICGAYGRDNAGDDAILESIVGQMRRLDPEIPIYVLSRKPLQTALRHRVGGVYTFNYLAYCRTLRRTRLYLNGGGSLIQDVTSSRSLWYYLLSIATARRLGNQVLMYGCGIGPVEKKGNRRLAGRVIDKNAHIITLRENFSLETLQEMGVKKPQMKITADPAILLEPAPREAVEAYLALKGIKPEEKLLLVSLRRWRDMENLRPQVVSAVEEISRKHGLRPVFLAMEPKTDTEICQMTAKACGGALCLTAPGDSGLLVGLIQRADLLLSMRLHALIFAAGVGTPLVGLSYDPKVMGFVRYLGQDLCIPLESLSCEGLVAAADAALSGAFDYAAEARRLRSLARENEEAAGTLLK